MAKNYQGNKTIVRARNNKTDSSKFPRKFSTAKEMTEQQRNRMIDWITFYRRNVHRFVEHYLGIKLHFYQRIWIYLMSTRASFVAIAARASAKTWLVGVLATAIAILYPNSQVVVVASTKDQAGVIVEDKIKSLRDNYPNVAREISNITTNLNKWAVDFHNGSTIKIVPSRDSARGRRATFIIYEEFRLIEKEILDSVIRPFSVIRQPPYLKLKEFQNLTEEPKEVFISSAYHKGLWWYTETKKTIMDMVNGGNSGFISFDVRIALRHKIKTLRQIKNEISKMDEITALEEYYNIPFGENSASYFKLKHFLRARKLYQAFYPQKDDTYNPKKNPYSIPTTPGEIRIISCDVAQRAGRANDLSINTCMRLLPTHKGYHRDIVYQESFSGENSIRQALRIKQLFYDFGADGMVLDVGAGGGGIPMYDQLGQLTRDDARGLEYPPFTIMQHPTIDKDVYEELSKRTLGVNAEPVIYPFSATAKLNSLIATQMRDVLQKRLISFLVEENKAEDYMIKNRPGEYMKSDDITTKAFFLSPFVNTSSMVNEAINLTSTLSGGNIKLIEPSSGRKDRIVSLMMGNFYAGLLDLDLLKDTTGTSDQDAILNITMIV